MDKEILEKRDWLMTKIPYHIGYFKKKKKKNKKRAFYLKILATSFGLITTLLLGLSLINPNPYLRIASITLALSITVISTISIFFNYKSSWVNYTMALNRLYELRDDFEYYLSGKPEKEIKMNELDKFKRRLNKILNDTNNSWKQLKK